jgi:MFS family permease
MMTSISSEYYQFILAQGICSPLGASFVFYAGLSCTATWFQERRALAFGIVASGSSLGGIVFPILLARLLPTVGFGWSLRISGFVVLALLIIANLMVRSRIKPVPRPFSFNDYTDPFLEPTFVLLMLSVTCGFFAMFIPINYIVLEAGKNGIDADLSGYLLAILNAGRFVLLLASILLSVQC